MSARWLTTEFLYELTRLDAFLYGARKTGAIQITVNYRNGVPLVARVFEDSPLIHVEMGLHRSTASATS